MARTASVSAPDALAEARIEEAIRRGELDGLPGAGRPLALDDDLLVPAAARLANRILKNAGFVPPEILARREIAELETALAGLADAAARARALTRLALLRTELGARRSRALARNPFYERRILHRLGGP
jgi:hypothetical protein